MRNAFLHQLRKNKLIWILFLINLFGITCYGVYFVVRSVITWQEEVKFVQNIAELNEKQGLMTRQDYLRLDQVRKAVGKSRKMEPEDYTWAISRFKQAFDLNHPNACLTRADYADLLCQPNNLSAQQKEELYQTAIQLFSTRPTTEDDSNLDKVMGANVMIYLRDKRAVPYLLPLLKHTDSSVKDRANEALQAINPR